MSGDIERLCSVILRIARERGADKTIRPSDAARAVGVTTGATS